MDASTLLDDYLSRRKHLKVTQAELAGELGWRKEIIVQIESGSPPPSDEQLRLMNEALGRVYHRRGAALTPA